MLKPVDIHRDPVGIGISGPVRVTRLSVVENARRREDTGCSHGALSTDLAFRSEDTAAPPPVLSSNSRFRQTSPKWRTQQGSHL
jgi:hypothetical protein